MKFQRTFTIVLQHLASKVMSLSKINLHEKEVFAID